MKKILILLCCCFVANTAHALIKGEGTHFDADEEFFSAFENCTPYSPIVPSREELPQKDMGPEYEYIKVIGRHGDKCIFDWIGQSSSTRLYFKVVKRCEIKMGEQLPILEGIKYIPYDKGSKFSHAIAEIMDNCNMIENVEIPNSDQNIDTGYITLPEKDGKVQLPESCR